MSELLRRLQKVRDGNEVGTCDWCAEDDAIAEIDRLTARVKELLEANNREVERRRQLKTERDAAYRAIYADITIDQFAPSAHPIWYAAQAFVESEGDEMETLP